MGDILCCRHDLHSGSRGDLQSGTDAAGKSPRTDPAVWFLWRYCGLPENHTAGDGPRSDGESHQSGKQQCSSLPLHLPLHSISLSLSFHFPSCQNNTYTHVRVRARACARARAHTHTHTHTHTHCKMSSGDTEFGLDKWDRLWAVPSHGEQFLALNLISNFHNLSIANSVINQLSKLLAAKHSSQDVLTKYIYRIECCWTYLSFS